MGVDEGNLLVVVMGVERYILTSRSHDIEIKVDFVKAGESRLFVKTALHR